MLLWMLEANELDVDLFVLSQVGVIGEGRYVRELDRRRAGREFDEMLLMRLQIMSIP